MSEEKPKKVHVGNEDFVHAVLECQTYEELANVTGLTFLSARARCNKLRKAGVLLPQYDRKGRSSLDVDGLNDIIAGV